MTRLREAEMVCADVLLGRGRSQRRVAIELGVSESTLRYRLGRRRSGALDGRARQEEACAAHEGVIRAWMEGQEGAKRPESVRCLYEELVSEHGYRGSYKAVVRYVRRRMQKPKLRPFRRVETVPGAQAQVDWVETRIHVEDLGGLVVVQALVMTLGHSRMWAVVWRLTQDFLSWIAAHNRALAFLGGVPATMRIDNLKTGVSAGAGVTAVLNEGYASYARQMGFLVDPCRVRTPSDKGKVERRGRDVKTSLIREGEWFQSLEHLQRVTEARILERARQRVCPVTGRSVFDTWQEETLSLRPLPETLPEPFDVQVSRTVEEGCLVAFEGHQYAVPFPFFGRQVEVRGCSGSVEIRGEGRLLKRYPRGTPELLLVDQSCYEGEEEARVHRPTPLGDLAKKIVLQRSWEIPRRSIAQYELAVGRLS
jgi:transposase